MTTKRRSKATQKPQVAQTAPPEATAALAPPPAGSASEADDVPQPGDDESTVIWGEALEEYDYIKVPRTVLHLGRYDKALRQKIGHGEMLLLLALAARKFKGRETAAFWKALAIDLGVNVDTVRRWGYALKKAGLLRIENQRKRPRPRDDGDPSLIRNDRNIYDIAPFVGALDDAWKARARVIDVRRATRNGAQR